VANDENKWLLKRASKLKSNAKWNKVVQSKKDIKMSRRMWQWQNEEL
jgi:hypothetical protein